MRGVGREDRYGGAGGEGVDGGFVGVGVGGVVGGVGGEGCVEVIVDFGDVFGEVFAWGFVLEWSKWRGGIGEVRTDCGELVS